MSHAEASIDGYNLVRSRNGGGVCLYIREDLSFNPRTDLHKPTLESVWVDLFIPKTKPIIIGCVYRPPDQSNFLVVFQDSLSSVELSNELYIFGDLNINLNITTRSNSLVNKQTLKLFGLLQLIDEPARVTEHIPIDH